MLRSPWLGMEPRLNRLEHDQDEEERK